MSELQESDNRIQSQELAHHMGYTEYPHMEMAATALKVGLQEDYLKHVADAERAGLEAGRNYMDSIIKDLASYALVSETLDDDNELLGTEAFQARHENYPGVRITKDEIIRFAEEQNVAGSSSKIDGNGHNVNPNANKASALWGSLAHLVDDIRHRDVVYPDDRKLYYRVTPLLELDMDIERHDRGSWSTTSDDLLNVSMDTLANLIDEFDRLKALYPSKSAGQILGTGFGDSKLAFLRDFVEYKKAKLTEEPTE